MASMEAYHAGPSIIYALLWLILKIQNLDTRSMRKFFTCSEMLKNILPGDVL